MKESFRVIDDFCPRIADVCESIQQSGFGTWSPNKGLIGSSVYEGMNFWGKHSYMVASLSRAMNVLVAPNNMFFRKTLPSTETAYIHSDRESGAFTCVAYLSSHDESYGTAFYRHKETGLMEMPPFSELAKDEYAQLRKDIVSGDGFEQTDFVGGKYNRAVIFHAPLFHSRVPKTGLESGRTVWVCHYHTPDTLEA